MNLDMLNAILRDEQAKYPEVKVGPISVLNEEINFTLEARNARGEPYHRHIQMFDYMEPKDCQQFMARVFSSMAGIPQV